MNRLASCTAAVLWASLFASAALASPPPQPEPDGTCEVVVGASVTITVDRQAIVDKPCIEIKKGKTEVVWVGSPDVQQLVITFKPGPDAPPDNPTCAGATCTLEKAKQAAKHGDFYYAVQVVLQDGTTVTVDPRLIIKG